jgi:hypothetical protein
MLVSEWDFEETKAYADTFMLAGGWERARVASRHHHCFDVAMMFGGGWVYKSCSERERVFFTRNTPACESGTRTNGGTYL